MMMTIIMLFECCIGIFFITSTTTKTPGAELPDSRWGSQRESGSHGPSSPPAMAGGSPVRGRGAAGPMSYDIMFNKMGQCYPYVRCSRDSRLKITFNPPPRYAIVRFKNAN